MKPNLILLLAACALWLPACSSTPTKVDHGPIHAQSFNFVTRGPRPFPDYAEKRQPIHALIQQAIAKRLAQSGVAQVPVGGDVTVGYLVIIGNNVSTTAIDDYFGYGEDAAALHDKAHDYYSASKNPNYFEAGTLVIDITDSKTFKLLKRGYVTRPTLRNAPEDAKAARIQEAVDAILSDLRIEH